MTDVLTLGAFRRGVTGEDEIGSLIRRTLLAEQADISARTTRTDLDLLDLQPGEHRPMTLRPTGRGNCVRWGFSAGSGGLGGQRGRAGAVAATTRRTPAKPRRVNTVREELSELVVPSHCVSSSALHHPSYAFRPSEAAERDCQSISDLFSA
jgi:hypothetical protein